MKQTVVIIDDDPDDIEMIEEALTGIDSGIGILSFEDCNDAYQKIAGGDITPDVIIFDI